MTSWSLAVVAIAAFLVALPGALHFVRSRRPRDDLDFNIIDEAIHHLDSEREPWSVHVDVRVDGRFDAARLREAVARAMAKHPVARAFQRPWRPWQTVYSWRVADTVEVDPLEIVECSEEDVDGIRARFQSARVPITAPPPFRLLLAHAPSGDMLMLNFNHAASDGVGTLRFIRSVARAYSRADDHVSAGLSARELARTTLPASARARWDRLSLLRADLVDALAAPPSRIAVVGGDDTAGFGFVGRVLDAADSRRVAEKRLAGGTVNDTLLGVLHFAIDRWNEVHGASTARLSTMMPVNVRSEETWLETVSNVTYFVSISTGRDDRRDLRATTARISDQTKRIKERGTAAALREILFASPALLLEVKRRLPALLSFGGGRFVHTAVLSNLGRVAEPLSFGELGDARELWFSPPCRMPLGLAVGAATYGGRLSLMFRYRRAQFAPDAAARFADLYVELLRQAVV